MGFVHNVLINEMHIIDADKLITPDEYLITSPFTHSYFYHFNDSIKMLFCKMINLLTRVY